MSFLYTFVMNDVKIRFAKRSDEQICQELIETTMRWEGKTKGFYKEDVSNIDQYFVTSGGCFLVAEKDGVIVGTLGMKKIGSFLGFMKRFYVHPDLHGQGIGKMLLQVMVEWMNENGIRQSLISTGKKEVVAHHLYESLGSIKKCEVNEGRDYLYELVL